MLPNLATGNGAPESQMVQGLLQEGRARIVAGDVGGALKVQNAAAHCPFCCLPWHSIDDSLLSFPPRTSPIAAAVRGHVP